MRGGGVVHQFWRLGFWGWLRGVRAAPQACQHLVLEARADAQRVAEASAASDLVEHLREELLAQDLVRELLG